MSIVALTALFGLPDAAPQVALAQEGDRIVAGISSLRIVPSGDHSGQTDAPALQAMIDAAAEDGSSVELGPGDFFLSTTLRIGSSSGLLIRGQGREQTRVHLVGCDLTAFELHAPLGGEGLENLEIRELAIEGTLKSADDAAACRQVGIASFSGQQISGVLLSELEISHVSIGIAANAELGGTFEDAQITYNDIHDIHGTQPGQGYGIALANARRAIVENNVIARTERHAIYQSRGGEGVHIRHNRISDHRVAVADGSVRPAIMVARSRGIRIAYNLVERAHDVALAIGADPDEPGFARDIQVAGNHFVDSAHFDIYLGSSTTQGVPCAAGYPLDVALFSNQVRRRGGTSLRVECVDGLTVFGNRWRVSNPESAPLASIRLITFLNDQSVLDRVHFAYNCGRLEGNGHRSIYTMLPAAASGEGAFSMRANRWFTSSVLDPTFAVSNPNVQIQDVIADVQCM